MTTLLKRLKGPPADYGSDQGRWDSGLYRGTLCIGAFVATEDAILPTNNYLKGTTNPWGSCPPSKGTLIMQSHWSWGGLRNNSEMSPEYMLLCLTQLPLEPRQEDRFKMKYILVKDDVITVTGYFYRISIGFCYSGTRLEMAEFVAAIEANLASPMFAAAVEWNSGATLKRKNWPRLATLMTTLTRGFSYARRRT
jgi:hypothetical protein